MMTRVRRFPGVLSALLALFLSSTVALAGTTGKITGQVTDKDTRETLVGVNITVEGTTLGGVTDANGNYTILNVSPGTYRLKASLVGYSPTLVSGVIVNIDQTSTVPFEMRQQAIEAGEVVITAERRAVQRDVSTSVAAVTDKDVRALPISTVQDMVDLQAGVENGMVIRGGGAEQSLFLLDGVTMRDPRNNRPINSVPLSSIQEISIERGGFNAEYGQARSGIVNVVTKEGAKNNYTASITARYSPPANKYFGISPFDANSMWLRPYLDPAVAWTGTQSGAWDKYTQAQYPQFDGWNALSERMLAAGDPNALSPAGLQRLFEWQHRKTDNAKAPDYNIDFGLGGPVIPDPGISEKLGNLRFFLSFRNDREMLLVPLTRPDFYEYTWALKMTSDLGNSMKLDVTGTIGKSYNVAVNDVEQQNSTDYLRTPDQITANNSLQSASSDARLFLDSYYSAAEVSNWSGAAQFTHALSPTSFYEIRLEHISRTYNTGPIAQRDTTRWFELFPGYFVDEAPFGWYPYLNNPVDGTGVNGMWMGGHTSTTRDASKISTTTLKGNFTTQFDIHNQFKAGFEFAYNDLNLNYGYESLQFPNENDTVRYHRAPMRGALFVQDKLEFQGFIANLGLRMDYSEVNTGWPVVSPYDPTFFSQGFNQVNSIPSQQAKAKVNFSPRLGISHPITENSKLFFNYGHFMELPTYEQLLRQSRGANNQLNQLGNPNLEMAKTVAYELGYDHSLFDDTYLLQLSAFYRDITNQVDSTTYVSTAGNFRYYAYNNNSYQDVRGFEVTIRKTRGMWWNGFANYTYQAVTGGYFGLGTMNDDITAQLQYIQANPFRSYSYTPQPYARVSIGFFTPSDLGGPGIGQLLFGDWNLTLLGDWRAGGLVTWNPSNQPLSGPNVQAVNYYNLNLRLTKAIPVGPVRFILMMDVTNVLNTRRLNLNSFYDYPDQVAYFGSLHLPASSVYTNIVGDDKVGDYRKDGVPYQPIEQVGVVSQLDPTQVSSGVIYYEKTSGLYMNYVNGSWSQVDPGRLKQVLDDKAYIDMPNETSFSFLNPRNYFFGITATIDF